VKITFLGLGQMGFAMADRLLAAGFDLTVHNRTRKKAELLLEKGARWTDSPREGARNCDILATMVSDDAALRTLLAGNEGFLEILPKNSIHLSLSTVSVAFSKDLEALHSARQQGFVSSPVFGRPDAVVSGSLRLLCAGKPEHSRRVLPVLNALGSRIFELGEDPSSANLVKLSGNFMIGSVLESLSEAMTLVNYPAVNGGA